MILSPERLQIVPRKVRPTRIVYATLGLGLALVCISWGLVVANYGARTSVVLTVFADGLIIVPAFILPLGKFRRDARLLKWGVAASAKITSQKVAMGRGGANLALAYAFSDVAGKSVTGRRVLWGDIRVDGRTSDPQILDALASPVVFYCAKNSRRHLFYPSSVAEFQG